MLQTSDFLYLKTSFIYAFFFYYAPHWMFLLFVGLWILVFRMLAHKEPHSDLMKRTAYHPSTVPPLWPGSRDYMEFWVAFLEQKWICPMHGKKSETSMWCSQEQTVSDKAGTQQFPCSSLLPQQSKNIFSTPLWRGLVAYFWTMECEWKRCEPISEYINTSFSIFCLQLLADDENSKDLKN